MDLTNTKAQRVLLAEPILDDAAEGLPDARFTELDPAAAHLGVSRTALRNTTNCMEGWLLVRRRDGTRACRLLRKGHGRRRRT